MEKFGNEEYRDDLANKLKDIRNSDEEEPKLARAKAIGYLEAKKETDEYQDAKEEHLKDIENFLPSTTESIVKMLDRIESEDERVEKVVELVSHGIEVPQNIVDSTFEYIKTHIQEEPWRKKVGHLNINGVPSNIDYFLESTSRLDEIIAIYEAVDTPGSLIRAFKLSQQHDRPERSLEIGMKLRDKCPDSGWSELVAETLERLGRVDEAKELLLEDKIYDNLLKLALRTNDKDLAQRVYEETYAPEKLWSLLKEWQAPKNGTLGMGYNVMKKPDREMRKGYSFFGLRQDDIELLINVATLIGRTDDMEIWKSIQEWKKRDNEAYRRAVRR